jgi:hypothetical protein
MLIGGDIVHNALAQSTGTRFTPACFSFGWVAYAFSALARVFGDGRLLPPPDTPVKVFNLSTGTMRSNENWAVGRLMRDLEARVSRDYPMFHDGIRITVFEAAEKAGRGQNHLGYSRVHVIALGVAVTQLVIAGLAWISTPASEQDQDRDWGILLVTACGIFAGSCFASLRQWAAEKLPERQNSKANFALTHGRGFKDVVVILGAGCCLDLDELAAADSPRNWRLWRKFQSPKLPATGVPGLPQAAPVRRPSFSTKIYTYLGEPLQLWLTRLAALIHAMFWLLILITIAGLKSNLWHLVGIATLGTIANLVIGAIEIPLASRLLPLRDRDLLMETRDADGIKKLETKYNCGRSLRAEFSPAGSFQQDEKVAGDVELTSLTDVWKRCSEESIPGLQGHGEREPARTGSPASSSVSAVNSGRDHSIQIQLGGNRPPGAKMTGRLETVAEGHESSEHVSEPKPERKLIGKRKVEEERSQSLQGLVAEDSFDMEEASPGWT